MSRGFYLRLALLPMVPLFLMATLPVHAWGVTGHRYINGVAIEALPAELRPLYAANREWIVQHAIDPDLWREGNRDEGPHHFIDLDTWGEEVATHFPQDYWFACGLYGKAALDKNGVVPWRIGHYYGKLVAAFQAKDARKIVEISAWLGHYAADIHVPFHATKNYDGQLTAQKGIHARFESDLVERQIKLQDIKVRPARRLASPITSAFGWAQASLALCTKVLGADKAAAMQAPGYGDAYYTAFGKEARPIALQRLEEGARDLASLWYSAWLAAGKPEIPAIADVHVGEPLEQRTHDPDLLTARKPERGQ